GGGVMGSDIRSSSKAGVIGYTGKYERARRTVWCGPRPRLKRPSVSSVQAIPAEPGRCRRCRVSLAGLRGGNREGGHPFRRRIPVSPWKYLPRWREASANSEPNVPSPTFAVFAILAVRMLRQFFTAKPRRPRSQALSRKRHSRLSLMSTSLRNFFVLAAFAL